MYLIVLLIHNWKYMFVMQFLINLKKLKVLYTGSVLVLRLQNSKYMNHYIMKAQS